MDIELGLTRFFRERYIGYDQRRRWPVSFVAGEQTFK